MTLGITIVLFDHLTPLDALGPFEVLSRLPDTRVQLAALGAPRMVRSESARASAGLALQVDLDLARVETTDVLLVPGGPATDTTVGDALIEELERCARGARILASVCTGALLLGRAGLLEGKRATTHWNARTQLAEMGATLVDARVVEDGSLFTAAGVSAGIDMALALAAKLCGPDVAQAIQLGIEYAPEPPFTAGSPTTAPSHVRDLALGAMRANAERLRQLLAT